MEIIAEIGQNHNGDMSIARELIDKAAENGADVAKFQLFEARALFPKEGNPWYDYNCQTEISREQVVELFTHCELRNIEFMASVFDIARLEWLEDLGARRYKIASRSISDKNLINALEATGKPLIVSLGMWEYEEFPVINTQADVEYLYCVSKYPTELSDLNFSKIDFKKYAGFSDHTIGVVAPMIAMARGARILEKHFTLDTEMYGPDHKGSMTPSELSQLNHFRSQLQECL